MKTFEKFLAQIKMTEQRLFYTGASALDETPDAVITSENNFPARPAEGPAPFTGVVYRKYISGRKTDGPDTKPVNPKQINNYLREHHVNITELINDRLLRERIISGDDTLDVSYL